MEPVCSFVGGLENGRSMVPSSNVLSCVPDRSSPGNLQDSEASGRPYSTGYISNRQLCMCHVLSHVLLDAGPHDLQPATEPMLSGPHMALFVSLAWVRNACTVIKRGTT